MSNFMLEDENANNIINPFVIHDLSLPGNVRQTGVFDDFSIKKDEDETFVVDKSVFCDYGLCKDANETCTLKKRIHPHPNIDRGVACKRKQIVPMEPVEPVYHISTKFIKFIILLVISLILYFLLL